MTRLFGSTEGKPSNTPRVTSRLLDNSGDSTMDIDMDAEDYGEPYKLEPHVQIGFDDMFNEPDGMKENVLDRTIGENVIRGCYGNVFLYVKVAVYFVLAIVVGLLASVLFAIVMALNSIVHVWICQPVLKLLFSWLRLVRALNKAMVRTFCDPCCHAFGRSLSHIQGRFRTLTVDARLQKAAAANNYGSVMEQEQDMASAPRD